MEKVTEGRPPRRRPARTALAAALCIAALPLLAEQQPASGPQAEEAADFARRSALAALHGPPKIFLDSIDTDGILRRLLGADVWTGLTGRQQELLRGAVRDHFAQALAPPPGTSGEIAWASVADSAGGTLLADLGLRYGSSTLKTRWTVRPTPKGWTVEDIMLVDPGLSLAAEVGRLLGPDPVRRRNTASEARARALPRVAGLIAIAIIVAVFVRRLPPRRRSVLWAAAVPALLFLLDGSLAVERALSERYALAESPPQPWRQFEKDALAAQAEGRTEDALAAWKQALDGGAPAGPIEYQMGLSARSRGAIAEAAADFARAVAAKPPAPGGARELGSMALAEGRNADALERLRWYLREAGPDPDSLAALAVVQINLGNPDAAVAAIASARALVGEDWRKSELEAQIYARAGNAAAAVAALRPLDAQGKLDRSALRAEPPYLPIATDPAWVSFLNEGWK